MQSISFKAQLASSKKAFDNLSILWGDLMPVRRPIPTGAIWWKYGHDDGIVNCLQHDSEPAEPPVRVTLFLSPPKIPAKEWSHLRPACWSRRPQLPKSKLSYVQKKKWLFDTLELLISFFFIQIKETPWTKSIINSDNHNILIIRCISLCVHSLWRFQNIYSMWCM